MCIQGRQRTANVAASGNPGLSKERGRRSPLMWLLLWGLVFASLLEWLPRQPTHRTQLAGHLYHQGFVSSGTSQSSSDSFLALTLQEPDGSGPESRLHLIDLTTGDKRSIPLNNVVQSRGFRGTAAGSSPRAEWAVDSVFLAGGTLVATMWRDDGTHCRIVAWEAHTGRESFRQESETCEAGLIGSRAWFQSVPSHPEPFLKLFDVASGQQVPTRLSADQLRIRDCEASPDGRFLVKTRGAETRVWNVETGEVVLTETARNIALSADGRWVAMQFVADSQDPRRVMTWKVCDLDTGRIVAEREVVLTAGVSHYMMTEFLDEDRVLAAYRPSAANRAEIGEIDVWRWQANSMEMAELPPSDKDAFRTMRPATGTYRPSGWVFWVLPLPSPAFRGAFRPQPRNRLVYDGQVVLDVATGRTIATLPQGGTNPHLSPDGRWGVLDFDTPRWQLRLMSWLSAYVPWISKWARPGQALTLCDVQRDRRTASLPYREWISQAFSRDGTWLATHDGESLALWQLPPRRPWGRAFGISLLVPLIGAGRLRKRRPSIVHESAADGAPLPGAMSDMGRGGEIAAAEGNRPGPGLGPEVAS